MKGVLIQYGCTIFLGLMTGMGSFCNVWPSYAIRILKSDSSPLGFKISQNVANLVSSLPMLSSLISTLMVGYIAETIGRKRAMILSGLLYTVAWSLIVTSRSTFQILLGRFITGLGSGISSVLLAIYTSEITQLSIQGSAATMGSLVYSCGVMASYLLGWLCSYDVICYANLTFLVVYVVLMSFLKESPSYLLRIGKENEALKSLKFYRGQSVCNAAILDELLYLKSQVNSNYNITDEEQTVLSEENKLRRAENEAENSTEKKNGWVLLFTVKHNRRAIANSVTFLVLIGSMGMVAVQTYAIQFFSAAAPALSPDLCSVIFSLVLVLSNGLAVAVIDLLPRRTMMVSHCLLVTFCLASLGAALRYGAPSWVPLAIVILYCLVFHLGVINVLFAQLYECYGPEVKSEAAVLVFCSMFVANFFVLFLFAPAVECIGIDGTFFVFAAISALTSILAYFFLKETRRVPLEQIQKMYNTGILYKNDAFIDT